jgi:voltage-gated potassium channel
VTALERWEKRAEWPLAAAAVAFLLVYAVPILNTHLTPLQRQMFLWADYALWAIFGADYLMRLCLAQNRVRWFSRHLHELAMVALPMFRPLRLLRLLNLLRPLNRKAMGTLHGKLMVYVPGATILAIICSSLAVLSVERGQAHANIQTIGDALWWAIVTITTVGYGDHFPVTFEGRLVAVGLMITGIALIGVITASVASWLVEQIRDNTEGDKGDVAALRAEIAELRSLLIQSELPHLGRLDANHSASSGSLSA